MDTLLLEPPVAAEPDPEGVSQDAAEWLVFRYARLLRSR